MGLEEKLARLTVQTCLPDNVALGGDMEGSHERLLNARLNRYRNVRAKGKEAHLSDGLFVFAPRDKTIGRRLRHHPGLSDNNEITDGSIHIRRSFAFQGSPSAGPFRFRVRRSVIMEARIDRGSSVKRSLAALGLLASSAAFGQCGMVSCMTGVCDVSLILPTCPASYPTAQSTNTYGFCTYAMYSLTAPLMAMATGTDTGPSCTFSVVRDCANLAASTVPTFAVCNVDNSDGLPVELLDFQVNE